MPQCATQIEQQEGLVKAKCVGQEAITKSEQAESSRAEQSSALSGRLTPIVCMCLRPGARRLICANLANKPDLALAMCCHAGFGSSVSSSLVRDVGKSIFFHVGLWLISNRLEHHRAPRVNGSIKCKLLLQTGGASAKRQN